MFPNITKQFQNRYTMDGGIGGTVNILVFPQFPWVFLIISLFGDSGGHKKTVYPFK